MSSKKQIKRAVPSSRWATLAHVDNYVGYIDESLTSTNVNTTGSLVQLTGPALGNGTSNRIGQNIRNLRIEVKGVLYGDSTANLNSLAFDLVYDKRPDKTTLPGVTNVFDAATYLGFQKVDNCSRFQVLAHKDYLLYGAPVAAGTNSVGTCCRPFNFVINLDHASTFSGSTGALADCDYGCLYIVWRGSAPSGTADAAVEAVYRTFFRDQ